MIEFSSEEWLMLQIACETTAVSAKREDNVRKLYWLATAARHNAMQATAAEKCADDEKLLLSERPAQSA